MVLIQTEDLCKTYQMGDTTVRALDRVSLEIEQGEMVAIMGPSGSGKSTFMNMVGCLDLASSGQYKLAGELVNELSSDQLASIRHRRIGFVFQQFNLLARTSALENVMLPLLYGKMPGSEREEHARNSLAAVDLADRASHWPTQLSGGQQQRVAIARALVNQPDLILADEPTGALDSQTSAEVMSLFQQLNSKGQTVILVTHEADVAAYADRVISFLDGRIREDSPQVRRVSA